MTLSGKSIVLGVTGGIAAYKAAELTSLLVKSGAEVQVVMTEAAQKFIGAATFQALTRHPVLDSVFVDEKEGQIAHIDLADKADLVIIAPATANTIGKLAAGLANDMLTTIVLAARAPVWIAPAMNVNMYAHPAVKRNLDILTTYGYRLIGPEAGRLACGWTGKGRLVPPEKIFADAEAYFSRKQTLGGKKVLVTAGPTREALDPVRFFSNRSSGKMGYAIAEAASRAGADVTLIAGPADLETPDHVHLIRVSSARDMFEAVTQRFDQSDIVIKAAAVADYRPEMFSTEKIKKGEGPLTIKMVRNPDILMELGRRKKNQILVGFAAETENLEQNALRKLKEKHADLLIANRVADGFEQDTNKATIFFADGRRRDTGLMSKKQIADQICAAVSELLETGAFD